MHVWLVKESFLREKFLAKWGLQDQRNSATGKFFLITQTFIMHAAISYYFTQTVDVNSVEKCMGLIRLYGNLAPRFSMSAKQKEAKNASIKEIRLSTDQR